MEPALSVGEWLDGKNARPKVVDLETQAVSTSSAPIATTPARTSSAPSPSAPSPSAAATPFTARSDTAPVPVKSDPAPASISTPTAVTERKLSPKEPEPKQEAKSLEIEQPDSDDDMTASPVMAFTPKSAGVSVVSTPTANGSNVTAVSNYPLTYN